DKEFYIPAREQLGAQSASNRQGRGDVLEGAEADRVLQILKEDSEQAYRSYSEMLNEDEAGNPVDPDKSGLARELARMNLTLNYYTQWYWKIDLHNLLHFCALRADRHAQYEIRVYADALLETVRRWCPAAYEAFVEYGLGGARLSARALEVVRQMIDGKNVSREASGLSRREWTELMELLGRAP
ncbi:MAG: FAD-dependent thymidylate synthase, partial [Alphaproteobacteria bacterium]